MCAVRARHPHRSFVMLSTGATGYRDQVGGPPDTVPWVPGLPEIVHSFTEDVEDRGYRPSRLWGQCEALAALG